MELTTGISVGRTQGLLFMMSKIQNLNGTHNRTWIWRISLKLFMMSKIQNLNGTHNTPEQIEIINKLFMMSKIQNLNGTHNIAFKFALNPRVVYDVKDTKFEWN